MRRGVRLQEGDWSADRSSNPGVRKHEGRVLTGMSMSDIYAKTRGVPVSFPQKHLLKTTSKSSAKRFSSDREIPQLSGVIQRMDAAGEAGLKAEMSTRIILTC